MYLAKFFHKAPDDDRLLLYTPDVLMGIHVRESGSHAASSEPTEFLRQTFATTQEGIAAYRNEAETLRKTGYIETHHTDYTLRDLKNDNTPKPQWQTALDELFLSMLAEPLSVQIRRLAALENSPAEREPLALWARAHLAAARGLPQATALCEEALRTLQDRMRECEPFYTWSLTSRTIEAQLLELLSRLHLAAGVPAAALAAIEQALAVEMNSERCLQRATILCDFFPDREEDAFDSLYRDIDFYDYSSITSRAGYRRYAARRAADAAANRGSWRWSTGHAPAEEDDIHRAEQELVGRLPDGYREFLKHRGESILFARMPDEDGELHFHPPARLPAMRDRLLKFLAITLDLEEAAEFFHTTYDVSLPHLIPIAEPKGASNALLLHLGLGNAYGRTYIWSHDDPFELAYETKDFEMMLNALLSGIEKRDALVLNLLEIYSNP